MPVRLPLYGLGAMTRDEIGMARHRRVVLNRPRVIYRRGIPPSSAGGSWSASG